MLNWIFFSSLFSNPFFIVLSRYLDSRLNGLSPVGQGLYISSSLH